MNVAGYLRVSSSEQDYLNQLAPIQDYCKAHWWPEPEIYAESETAWKQGHQRELARLLSELRTGRRRYDYLVIFALDRLTRGGIRAIFPLLDSFESLGCKIISVKENWIPESGPLRDVFVSMIAWASKFESDRKSQNTLIGLDKAKERGVTLGRPKGSKDRKRRHKKRPVVYRYAKPENHERESPVAVGENYTE